MELTAEKINTRIAAVESEIDLNGANCANCQHCITLRAVRDSARAMGVISKMALSFLATGNPAIWAYAYSMGMADGIALAEADELNRMKFEDDDERMKP